MPTNILLVKASPMAKANINGVRKYILLVMEEIKKSHWEGMDAERGEELGSLTGGQV